MTYRSFDDQIRANGNNRHLERAISYASAGYPSHYYEGSMRKALRNFKKADSFKLDPLIEAVCKPFMDMLSQKIADGILYGTQYTKFTEDGLILDIEARDIYK